MMMQLFQLLFQMVINDDYEYESYIDYNPKNIGIRPTTGVYGDINNTAYFYNIVCFLHIFA